MPPTPLVSSFYFGLFLFLIFPSPSCFFLSLLILTSPPVSSTPLYTVHSVLFSFTSRLLFPSSFSWICSVSFFDILDILVYLIGLLHDRNFSSTCSFYLFQLHLSLSLLSLSPTFQLPLVTFSILPLQRERTLSKADESLISLDE